MKGFITRESEPVILIISGLSGAGKDSVIKRLNKISERKFRFVVTCNTRAPRVGEVDGKDYHFVTRERFLEMIANDEMVEYSQVYDDYKGVPRFEVENALASGQDLLLRVDYQGMLKIKKVYPDAVSIFLIPPDSDVWKQRLTRRGTESEEAMQIRIDTAKKELDCLPAFDYLVVNNDLDTAAREVLTIVAAEHYRTTRRKVTQIDE